MNAISRLSRPKLHSTAICWHLTDYALIEEGSDWCRVYGRWDKQFGCWNISRNGLTKFNPDWIVLGHLGQWLEPEGTQDDAWYYSRTAIAAYFSLIPTSVRLLAAPHGDKQWEQLETFWLQAQLKSFHELSTPTTRQT